MGRAVRYHDGRAWHRQGPDDNDHDTREMGARMSQDAGETEVAEAGWESAPWPAARHAARLRRRARQGWRQIGFRRQFVAILVAAACVSAVGTVALAALCMPPVRFEAGVLLVIGLALTVLCLLAGYRLSGPVSRRAYDALTGGLDDIAESAVRMEALSSAQTTRARQQAHLARQLSEEVRALGETAERLEQGVALLRETAGAIWAEMSYPASAVDAPIRGRSARQAAVTASQLGAALEQAASLCYRLRARTNLVIAEADLLGAHGRETERQLGTLRAGVVRVEEALGRDHSPTGSLEAPQASPQDARGRAVRLDEAGARAMWSRADTHARSAWGLLRALGAVAAQWGARRVPTGDDPRGASPGRAALVVSRGLTAHGPGNSGGSGAGRMTPGRHSAAGRPAHPGNSTSWGRAPSHPRLPGEPLRPRGASGGRFAMPDGLGAPPESPPGSQPDQPRRARHTPQPGGDEWLNGPGGAR